MSTDYRGIEDVYLGWSGGNTINPRSRHNCVPKDHPLDIRKICRVFLGKNFEQRHFLVLLDILNNFDNRFADFVLTAYRGSLSNDRLYEVLRLANKIKGSVELRSIDPVLKLTAVTRNVRLQYGRKVSSFISITVDHLNGLTEDNIQQIFKLPNIQTVQILAPTKSLLTDQGTLQPCRNTLDVVWNYVPKLRQCMLPLDLFELLTQALAKLAALHKASLKGLELTAPIDDEISHGNFVQGSYEETMSHIAPHISALTALKNLTMPIAFITPTLLRHVSSLPQIIIFNIVPIRGLNPVNHVVEALRKAGISQQGPKCFEQLNYLDMGSPDYGQLYHRNAEESAFLSVLHAIFVRTIFCGGWIES